MTAVQDFHLAVPDDQIADLHRRLDAVRWPEKETVDDWSQGVPLAFMQRFCHYWRHEYDWRRCEATLNRFGQYRATIDGLGIHFLHLRSPEPDALPLLLTHGWPGSVIEFVKAAEPLSNPAAHGGDPRQAFHLVIPSLPGYGFSEKPSKTGWDVVRIARAWTQLMRLLGYQRFVAQGGDWGAMVTTALAGQAPPECLGVHLNMPLAFPTPEDLAAELTPAEAAALAHFKAFNEQGNGYSKQQSTRPQTLGYSLVDSPVGQAAWIVEKFHAWSDCDGDPLSIFTMDELLDNIMLYWLSGSGASSGRLYWQSFHVSMQLPATDTWSGCTIFPKEILRPSRRWAEHKYRNIGYWSEATKGGHFAAMEQPAIFVDEVRACFAGLRG